MSLSRPWNALGRLNAITTSLVLLLSPFTSTLTLADNPIIQTIYTADPAPMVYNNRVYLFTGHDEDGSVGNNMRDWRLFSSSDMANWQDHGVVLKVTDFAWSSGNAWAGQVIERNGKFYYYVPVLVPAGGFAIGVAVSDTITGPYRDAIGNYIVRDGQVDPTVFIDDDGQAYMYWGNPELWYVRLNEDMISYSGEPTRVELTPEGFGPREGEHGLERPTAFEEGPWLYKRGDTYYMAYAANCCQEDLRYSTGPSATGPWTYRGIMMPKEGGSASNHPGLIEYQGRSYLFYHNDALPGGGDNTRSVAVEEFTYGADGSIPEMNMSSSGPAQIGTLDPFIRQEAETAAWSEGVETEVSSAGGICVSYISPGNYIKVQGVNFGAGASRFKASVASGGPGGQIEIRLGGVSGNVVGTCSVSPTGDYQTWTEVSCDVTGADGAHDLYFVFTGTGDNLFNFDWWQFE
jgi:arabinoxylan arabinofuranohydrolase